MKAKQMIIPFILMLIMVAGVGCKNDEVVMQLEVNSQTSVIQKKVAGINFRFSLLKARYQPSTVFKEGENIIFSFSIENALQDTIFVSTDFITPDFYRVFKSDNIDMGKPWTGLWCDYSLAKEELAIAPSNVKELNCPWVLNPSIQADYPLCMSQSKSYLMAGDYYTFINLGFHYRINKKPRSIENLKLLINFRVTKN
jgi:hypothetical protein